MLGSAPLGGAPLAGPASSGPMTYTLSAAPGAFALVGDGNTFGETIGFTGLQPGTFALAGGDAHLFTPTYLMAAQPGALLLGGTVQLAASRIMPALSAAYGYALTATPSLQRDLAAGAGAFALAGGPLSFLKGFSIQAAAGTFALAGAVSAVWAHRLPLQPRAFTLTGRPAVLRQNRVLPLSPRVLLLDAAFATLGLSKVLQLAAGALRFGTGAAGLLVGRKLAAQPATYTLVGTDASIAASHSFALRPGVFSINATAQLLRGRVAAFSPLPLSLAGRDTSVAVTRRVRLVPAAFAAQGDVSSQARRAMRLDGGAVGISTTAVMGYAERGMRLDGGSFALAFLPPYTQQAQRTLVAEAGPFSLNWPDVALGYSASLSNLGAGPRWLMVSTITVAGQETVQDFVAGAPLQVAQIPAEGGAVSAGPAVQSYPIAEQLSLTLNHGLSYVPRVTITGPDGTEYDGDIQHTSGVVTVTLGERINGTVTIGG